jgi:hypothetical protein
VANGRARVNFNAGEKAADVREKTPKPIETCFPEPMTKAMHNQCVYARIGGENLKMRTRRWVTVEDDRNIFF